MGPGESAAPAVSVAIRAFRERWLGEAIDSVLGGTFEDLELIVYDDRGGLDAVASRHDDPRLSYHRAGDDGGPGGRFAAAAAICRGRYIAVLDDDDSYAPAFLERLVGALEETPQAGIAFCKVHYRTSAGLRTPADPRRGGLRPEVAAEVLAFRTFIPPSTMVIRREAWEEVAAIAPFPPAIAPDAYIHVRAGELGWGHLLVDAPLATRRFHPAQTSRSGLPIARMAVATWEILEARDAGLERIRRRVLARKRVRLAVHLLARGDATGSRRELELSGDGGEPRWRRAAQLVRLAAAVPVLGPLAARGTLALLALAARLRPPPAPAR